MVKWDPLLALQLIEKERISSFTGVPTMSLDLLNHPDFDKYDTSTLKSLVVVGRPHRRSSVSRQRKPVKVPGKDGV